MSSINLFIKENVGKLSRSIYVTPDIPEKKLNNVIKAYNFEEYQKTILAIFDNTLFGSATDGLLFTGERFVFKKDSNIKEFFYKDITSVKYIKDVKINDKGKESIREYIKLELAGITYNLEYLINLNYQEFEIFLTKVISDFEEYKEENQLITIAEMPEDFKVAYMKILINMAFSDDQQIDERELAEILSLMTKLELKSETRFIVRNYLTEISTESIEKVDTLVEIMKNNSEASHHKSIMISLVKDIINIYFITKTPNRDFEFLNKNKHLFNISDDEIDLAFSAIENDYKLLNADLDDDAIQKNMKELVSKAASVGAPLGAVYLSGSVLGMSAAGMTSGLATLGMGGVLGLSSMATGIGVAVLLGVGVYKGMQHLTGANKLTKYATRSLMLQEAIKQTQKTISLAIEDINFLIIKLNDVNQKHSNQDEVIKKLKKMVFQYSNALKQIDTKSNQFQNSSNRLKCPKELDEARLRALTSEPTKKVLYDFVISNYDDKTFILKDGINTENLEKIAEILNVIGYFEVANAIKGKIKELFK